MSGSPGAEPRERLDPAEAGPGVGSSEAEALGAAAVLEQIAEGVIVTDQDGRIVLVNQAAARIHGVKRLDVDPDHYSEVYHLLTMAGEPHPPADLPLSRAVRNGETVIDAHWRIRRPDGSEVVAIGTARPLLDSGGVQKGAILTMRDDTARHQSELDLAESETRFRNLADHAPVMIWVTEPDGFCSYLNRLWYEFTGQTPEQAEGFGWLDTIHPDDRAEAERQFLEANAKGEGFRLEYRLRRADGAYRWAIDAAMPRFAPDGTFLGYVGSVIDIDERHETEAVARDRAEELQAVLDAVPAAIWIARDPEGREIVGNRASYDLLRLQEGSNASLSANEGHRPSGFKVCANERELAPHELPVQRAASGETVARFEEEVVFDDGTTVSLYGNAAPLFDTAGKLRGGVAAFVDVTERKRAEEALRESVAQFSAMADNISQFAWMANPDGWIFWYNRRWYDYTGTDFEAMQGWGWQAVHHPDHVDRVTERFSAAVAAGEPWEDTFPLRSRDGEYRWFLSRAMPIRDDRGRIVRWFGTNTDVTGQQRYEQHLKLMVDELNHRVKNTLSIVQSLALQTFGAESTTRGARDAFEGRLSALAIAHNLLTRQNWESADLEAVVSDALHACAPADCFTISGPRVRLEPKTVVTIAMALHELCTNATKYGSLSAGRGHVTVKWSVSDGADPRLSVRWAESGGPPVSPPAHKGFGSRMIERALASELGGSARLDFRPEGVVCEIDARLPGVAHIDDGGPE